MSNFNMYLNGAVSETIINILLSEMKKAVIITDSERCVCNMNLAAEELTGYSSQAVKGKELNRLLKLYSEGSRAKILDKISCKKQSRQGNALYHNTILETQNISPKKVALSVFPLLKDRECLIGWILLFSDSQPSSEAQKDDQCEKDRVLSVEDREDIEPFRLYMASLMHDINAILTNVISNIGLADVYLRKGIEDGSKVHSCLEKAENDCIKAGDLARELINYSKESSGAAKNITVNEIIENCVDMLNDNIIYEFNLVENPCRIDVESSKIERVVNNIVQNAVQSMKNGGVLTIKTENSTITDNSKTPLSKGNYLNITIADTGCGISKEDAPKVFKPFFTRKENGTGLGLITAKAIVEEHYGQISFESVPGKGTTFFIYFPEQIDFELKGEEVHIF